MGWRDNLRSASFRGVPFHVLSASTSFGRRTVLHEYPFKEIPYSEDMGKAADEFTIIAYIVNNLGNNFDYFGERNALIDALKKEGSGLLIHPFYGEQLVNVSGKAIIDESFDEGGIARFSITFIQAGLNQFPSATIDPLNAIDDEALDVLDSLKDSFTNLYSNTDEPGFVSTSVIESLTSFGNMATGAINSIHGSVSAQLSTAKGIVTDALDTVSDNVGAPCDLANNMVNAFNGFLNLINVYGDEVSTDIFGACSGRLVQAQPITSIKKKFGKSIINSLMEITLFGEPIGGDNTSKYGGTISPISVITPTRARQAGNRILITNMLRNSAIVTATRIAARIDYKSQEATTEIRDIIIDAIDSQLTKMGDEAGDDTYKNFGVDITDNDSYMAMERMRSSFVPAMTEYGANLANIINYQTKYVVESTLTLAYDRYNDLNRIDEIYNRNETFIKHPGFIPCGETIEILSQ